MSRSSDGRMNVQQIINGGLLVAGAMSVALANAKPVALVEKLAPLGGLALSSVLALLFPRLILILSLAAISVGLDKFVALSVAGFDMKTLTKLALIGAIGVNIIRFGHEKHISLPLVTIVFLIFVSMLVPGRHPALGDVQIIKTAIGLFLLFLFDYMRTNERDADRYLLFIAATPAALVVLGVFADAAGTHPLFRREYTGALRLQGLSIPAYMAYTALIGLFVATIEVLRKGDRLFYALAAVNLAIIFLTGARMGIFCAGLFGLSVFLFVRSATLTSRLKLNLAIVGGVLFTLLLVLYWPNLEARLAGRESQDQSINLSGRGVIWEVFVAEIVEHPWLGRGMGANTLIVSEDVIEFAGTSAAHNEYLRLAVDVGILGTLALIVSIGVWIRRRSRHLDRPERFAISIFAVLLLIFSLTSNTLIALPGILLFFALSMMFKRPPLDPVPAVEPHEEAVLPRAGPRRPRLMPSAG